MVVLKLSVLMPNFAVWWLRVDLSLVRVVSSPVCSDTNQHQTGKCLSEQKDIGVVIIVAEVDPMLKHNLVVC